MNVNKTMPLSIEKGGFIMIGKKMRFLLISPIIMLIIGCGAYQMQKAKNKYYPTWPKHIQEAVDKKEVILGMDKAQVQIATGTGSNLIEKRTTITEGGVSETWILWKSFMGWNFANSGISKMVLIHFENGIVDSISYN
jgi:hypothetical protein